MNLYNSGHVWAVALLAHHLCQASFNALSSFRACADKTSPFVVKHVPLLSCEGTCWWRAEVNIDDV